MIAIARERPDHPQVGPLLRELDDYLGRLYPPEANHILDTSALMAPDVHFFVARSHEDDVVGCAAWRHVTAPSVPGAALTFPAPMAYAEIKRMMVRPDQRGRRIGAQLLQALELDAAAHGLRIALLETGADQVEAVRLYQRSGYRPCAAFGGYPDNGLSLFFHKALTPQDETP